MCLLFSNKTKGIVCRSTGILTIKALVLIIKYYLQKAQQVAKFFQKDTAIKDLVFIYGHGATKPLDTNETELGRSINRRVEFKFVRCNSKYQSIKSFQVDIMLDGKPPASPVLVRKKVEEL